MAGKLKPLDVERETRPGKYADGDGLYLIVKGATSKNRIYQRRMSFAVSTKDSSGGMSGRSKAAWGVKRATPFTCESYCLKTNASLRSISEK